MTMRWFAFGVGGGDVPPRQAALDDAAAVGADAGAVVCVDNLCRRAVEGRASLPSALYGDAPLVVVAEHPRAVRSLLEFATVPLKSRDVRWVVAKPTSADGETCVGDDPLPDGPWIPWYPVIDAERCTRCGQCVRFCLFGVYAAASDGLPTVVKPENCKNRCPACARICPAAAIVFPRYEESPFNGDPVADDDARLAVQRDDVKRLLGDDPMAALRARQAKARTLLDGGRFEAALAERERHLRASASEERT